MRNVDDRSGSRPAALRNRLLALEPRMLFDGAAPAVVDKATDTRSGKEDTAVTITNLSITDAEHNNQTVTLDSSHGKLTIQNTSGLAITGNASTHVTLSGSLDDINNALNGMSFLGDTDYNGAASFTVKSNDGTSDSATATVNLNLSPVNDAPRLTGGSLTVNEGGSVTFDPAVDQASGGFIHAQLGLTEVDNTQEQVIFKITDLAQHGKLMLDLGGGVLVQLTTGSTFSAAQLSKLTYVHDGSQVTDPSGATDFFKVNIDDGAGGLLTNQQINILVKPVDQAPTVGGSITVIEGEQNISLTTDLPILPGTIDSTRGSIQVTDPDQAGGTDYQYHLAGLPIHGTLKYDGVVITDSNFGFNDLSKLTYSHDGSEPTATADPYTTDSFQLVVTDDGGGTSTPQSTTATIKINILANDNDPTLTHHDTQTLDPGVSQITVTNGMLQVSDVDSQTTTLTYTVTGVPNSSEGYFERDTGSGATLLVLGSSFTQDDIDKGFIKYVSRGASATPRTDTLTFTVKDGDVRFYPTKRDGGIYEADDATLAQNTFSVIVPPDSGPDGGPPPALPPVSTGPQHGGTESITLLEGGTSDITAAQLHATDDNSAVKPENITYRLLTMPSSGTLMLNGKALSQFDTFTQLDIDNGNLHFVHSGAEDFIDSFQYDISDGNITTAARTFSISATPQNDTPVATLGPQTPTATEGQSTVINTSHIVLSDSDSQGDLGVGTPYANTNILEFTITSDVQHGTLLLNGVVVHAGQIVTAAQLAAGALTYQHDGTENFNDSFSITPFDDQNVTAGTATATNHESTGAALVVAIKINPVNDAPVFVGKTNATGANAIYEGGSVTIGGNSAAAGPSLEYSDSDNSTTQRQYRITTGPAHGQLIRNGVVLGIGSVFTQQELDAGVVRYVHDGSETRSDSFQYVVSDGDWSANDTGAATQGGAITPSEFDIEIKPVNDKPTVTAPTGPVKVDSSTASNNPVGGFQVGDVDAGSPGSTDFEQVTVRLLDQNGVAFLAGDYKTGGNAQILVDLGSGVTVTGVHNGDGDYLVFQGTQAEVNAALASLHVQFPNDGRNAVYQVQVVVDDRLRDGSGNLIPGVANGGDMNQSDTAGGAPTAIPTADSFDGYTTALPAALDHNLSAASVKLFVSETNEAPVLTAPGSATTNEDAANFIGGTFVVSDAESDTFGLPVTVKLEALGGFGSLGVGGSGQQTSVTINGHVVTITGDDTGTLILTGQAKDIQDLLNDNTGLGLTYKSASNDNADRNGADPGDVTVRMTMSEGDAAVGNDTGSGSVANPDVVKDIAVTIDPTNDKPTVTAGSGAIVVDQGGVDFPISGVQVADPDVADGIQPGEGDFVQVTVRLLDDQGHPFADAAAYAGIVLGSSAASGATIDATYSGNQNALVIRGSIADVNAYLAGLKIQFSAGTTSNTDKHYKLDVVVDDRLRDPTTGALDGSNLANGGKNLDSSGTDGVANVPTDNVDPYAAVPGDLGPNVSVGDRDIFLSGINDPAKIDATDISVPENDGKVSLAGHVTVSDSDSIKSDGTPGDNLTATISIDKGTITAWGAAGLGGTVTLLNDHTLQITGATLDQINARLAALEITTPADEGLGGSVDWNGSFHVTVVVNDGGNSGQRPGSLPGDTNNPAANPGDYDYADGTSNQLVTTRTFNVTVTAVNDAPTRTDNNPVTLPPVVEDSANPPGDTVQNLFSGKFQDGRDTVTNGSSADNFAGVAITGNGAVAGQGNWQYSTDGGVTWTDIPTNISANNALLLDTNDQLRFKPAGDFNGTPGALDVRLIDSSTPFTDGATQDLSGTNSGGTTPFSDSNNDVKLTTSITAVNDAPVLTGPGSITVREDVDPTANAGSSVDTILGSIYTDAKDNQSGIAGGENHADALQGIVILDNTADAATQGKWQYSVAPGVWVDVPIGTNMGGNGTAIFLPHDAVLRFQPVADYNGAPPALTFTALDGSDGVTRNTVQANVTVSATGGTTIYSAPNTLAATVTPVNDAPDYSGLDSGSPVAIKGGTEVRLDTDGSVLVHDTELDVSGNGWQGATLTVQRQGGANANDVFGFDAASHVSISGGNLLLNGVIIGSVVNGSGTMQLTFNTGVSASDIGEVMGAVTYRNTSTDPAASPNVLIDFKLDDQNPNNAGGGTAGGGQDQGEEGAKSATHTVTVHLDTPPPVTALPNQANVDSAQVDIDITGGFSDPDAGDTQTYGASGLPTGLSIDPATGHITGTLDHSASQGGTGGVYTITVTATDSHGAVSSQDFTLTVTNPDPVAQDDTGATDSVTPTSGDVIVGHDASQADSDSDGDTLVVSQVNGNPGNVGTTIVGDNGGLFTLNADGTYSFDPNGDFAGMVPGQTTQTSITYQISDGEGGFDTATLTITVSPPNFPPVANPDLGQTDAKTPGSGNVITGADPGQADSDPDGGTLTVVAIGGAAGNVGHTVTGSNGGQFVVNPDGTYSFDPHGDFDGLKDGESATTQITYTISDGQGGTASTTLTITVTGVNDAPTAVDDAGATLNTTPTQGDVLPNDHDPDGDALTVTAINGGAGNVGQTVTGSNGGQFLVNADGSYSFDPHGDFNNLTDGKTATTQITYTVSDGEGGTATATLTITVSGVDTAPHTAQIPDRADVDGTTGVKVDISHSFTDPDGDPMTYQATGLPPGLSLDPATGLITGTIDKSASQSGTAGHDGVYKITVTATDDHGLATSETFVWKVTNPSPTASDDSGTTPNDVPLHGDVLPNDHDPDGDKLSVQSYTVAGVDGTFHAGDTAVIAGVGSLTLNADGSYVFVAVENYAGNVPVVSYQVVDGEGGSANAQLRIAVSTSNHVQPLPPDSPLTRSPLLGGALEQTVEQAVFGNTTQDLYETNDAVDDGGVLHIEYWSLHPDVYRISRQPLPALHVTHAVRQSQEAAWWPDEPATIRSQVIAERLEMPYDLHVVRAVEASQRTAAAHERLEDQQRYSDTPGADPLFNDFDPLSRLARTTGPEVLHGRKAPPARHAPSFTQQLNHAAGATRAPATPAPARTPTVKP